MAGEGMTGCIWFQSQTAMFSAVLTCTNKNSNYDLHKYWMGTKTNTNATLHKYNYKL